MSMSTSLRFEVITSKKSLENALNRQKNRIENDELFAAREKQAKLEAAISLKSEWNENLAKVAETKKMVNDRKTKDAELKCARKAHIAVRRSALQNLLQTEYMQHEEELNAKNKAFFIQRI